MTNTSPLRIDPTDWHVPTLAEVFALATAYPDGGPIFLDTKLPSGDEDVARRLGEQYLELFVRFPDIRGRAFIACPDGALLDVIKDVFAAAPGFADFRDFALDHEELSAFALGHDVATRPRCAAPPTTPGSRSARPTCRSRSAALAICWRWSGARSS